MGQTTKNNDGSYTTTRDFTFEQRVKAFFILLFTSAFIILAIAQWNEDHPKKIYTSGQWSSLVLEFPPETKDWKEWKGNTYCLIEEEWHECEPNLVNSALRGDK
jgi:hypothetical protein